MTRTNTKQLNFEKLEQKGDSGVLVTRLMMACNDLTDANRALSNWKALQTQANASPSKGTGMYFVRIEIAHLYEGMKIIEEIKKDASLMQVVNSCDKRTQDTFESLLTLIKDGNNHKEYKQLIGRVRNNLTFHYDESGKLIETAIADRASRVEARISSVTRGSNAHLWDFKAAHDIAESIVTRQIWGIPKYSNLQVEADKKADRVHEFMCWFLDFSGELIWKFLND